MPSEPLPRDRKDFLRERKNERSKSENLGRGGGGGGGSTKWRDIRRVAGYGKQGDVHMPSEESFRGFGPTRSNDKILDDESFLSFGKNWRNTREIRSNPFSQRGWKGQNRDAAAATIPSLNGTVILQDDVIAKRSVDDTLIYNSHHPDTDFGNNCNQFHFKDRHDKNVGVSGSCTGQRFEGDNSLGSIDWKTLKWTRSGSLSSRGSGFSHSSSSRSIGVDSGETKVEVHPQNVSPIQSPSGDAATCVTSAAPSEETSSRKKPRLGWGEGLAKYEKKKGDGPDDTAGKNGMLNSGSNIEPVHFHSSNVVERSPRPAGLSDCTSPATPSSVACSSSTGVEEKSFVKMVNVDTANLCGSPCPESQNRNDGLAFNLESMEVISMANLSSSIGKLLQSDEPSSMDSGFVRSTAMNKLLLLKDNVSKKLEITESEIDLLENELKLLVSDTGSACTNPVSFSIPLACIWKPSEELCTASNLISGSTPLQLHSSGEMVKEKTPLAMEGAHVEGKGENIDSPGTATSKLAEPFYLVKLDSHNDGLKNGECLVDANTSGNDVEVKSAVYGIDEGCANAKPSEHIASNDCLVLSGDDDVHREHKLYDSIAASNEDSAHKASDVFSKWLPTNLSPVGISMLDSSSCWKNNPLVKEKFAKRKRFLRFKEKVLTLKFRAFQHLWKEDLRLLSIKRTCVKTQKKFEVSSRVVHNGYQRHRTSNRSRFSSPTAGNLRLVPTTEVINCAKKLLANSHMKIYRDALKMPALVLDKKERTISRFISRNGLVEDPCAAEKERHMINPWTSEEREIFLDKLHTMGKDFRRIALFLDHKTTADCVEFYYKNHKSDCFQRTKTKPDFAKKAKSFSSNTYLITSGKRWNRDSNAASLDMLGAVSAMAADAANVSGGLKDQQKCPTRLSFGISCDTKIAWGDDGILKGSSSSLDILGNGRENKTANVLAGICGSLSSEAMSSCTMSSIDIGEGYIDGKCKTARSSIRRPLTPEVPQNIDEKTCSDDSCGEMVPSDWTDEEKSIFIEAVASYGKDFSMISQCVRTRSMNQCKVFFSKARKCLGLDMMYPGSCNMGTPSTEDGNGGGGSDTENAGLLENGSVICSDKLGSKTDEDLRLSTVKANDDETYSSGAVSMHPGLDQFKQNSGTGELDVKDIGLVGAEDIVSIKCEKEETVFDTNSNVDNHVGSESVAAKVLESGFSSSYTNAARNCFEHGTSAEPAISVEANYNRIPSTLATDGDAYADHTLTEEVRLEVLLPENNLDDTDHLATGASRGYEQTNAVKLDPGHGYECLSSVLQDPAVVQTEKSPNHHMTSKNDLKNTFEAQLKCSASTKDHQKLLCGNSLLDHVDPSQIMLDFPFLASVKNGMSGNIYCNKPASPPSISEVCGNFHADHNSTPHSCLRKCSSLKHQDAGTELQFLPQDQLKDNQRRPKPHCLSDSDNPKRNGDVKLFGQILSHPSNQQKPNSRAEKEERDAKHATLSDNSFHLKFSGNQSVDKIFASTKFDHNSYLGLRNLPVRSFGFWDGSRIQTGFPSLPESAILLAKYPAAFGNYPTSSSKIDQQQLHRSNDGTSNGISVIPTREFSSNKGVTDFQAYRSHDVTKLQPLTVDLKQQQDMFFSDMQARGSEFEAVSSIQQQSRGVVGINVLGRGGILLGGGPCTGVSDPVAALKLHYAKTEQYSNQTGSIMRKEEAWGGNVEVDR